MTTLAGVKKAGQVAMATNTLVTFGDTCLTRRFESNSKIFKIDTPDVVSLIGMACTVAHFPVLRKAMTGCEFDKNSGGPIDVFTLKLKASS